MKFLIRPALSVICGLAGILVSTASSQAQYPSSIAIEYLSGGTWSFRGNGVLLGDPANPGASRYVLTADQVVNGFQSNPWDLRVVAGTCSLTNPAGAQVVGVASIALGTDPGSGLPTVSGSFGNDIAVLTLATPILYGANVAPARLPHDNSNQFAGSTVQVAGWWQASCPGPISQDCLTLMMAVITTAEAATLVAGTGAQVCDEQLCLYDPANIVTVQSGGLGAGVYAADSGNCSGEQLLVGIVSWGFISLPGNCTNPAYPLVTTRVSSYLGWINTSRGMSAGANLGRSMGCSCSPCGCSSMRLSSNGQYPQSPNPNFELRITHMPDFPSGSNNPFAILFIGLGNATPLFPLFCGNWYVPPVGAPYPFGLPLPSGITVSKSPCNHEIFWPLPLGLGIGGYTLTAQAMVLCDVGTGTPGFGLTNAWEFTTY